jgi:hypothetical protein
MTGKNRIIIYGPKDEGTYMVEFRKGDVLTISIPRTEAHVLERLGSTDADSTGLREALRRLEYRRHLGKLEGARSSTKRAYCTRFQYFGSLPR